jgi:hypothetical protein
MVKPHAPDFFPASILSLLVMLPATIGRAGEIIRHDGRQSQILVHVDSFSLLFPNGLRDQRHHQAMAFTRFFEPFLWTCHFSVFFCDYLGISTMEQLEP